MNELSLHGMASKKWALGLGGGVYPVVHLKTLFIKKNINQKHLKNTEGERECINM